MLLGIQISNRRQDPEKARNLFVRLPSRQFIPFVIRVRWRREATVHEKQNETKRCDINYSKHSVTMESPGTVAVQWTGEKFRLPLPGGDFSGGDDASAAGVEEVGALAQIEATEATEGPFVRNGEGDERCDGLDNDLHLRIEVWQGKHCHGQVGARDE